MPARAMMLLCSAALGAALTLAACERTPDEAQLAKLDNQITGNQADPALTSALEDPILTDPALSQQSNRNAVREAGGPVQAQYPAGGGPAALPAQRRAEIRGQATPAEHREMVRLASGDGIACGAPFEQGVGWSRRLPATFRVLPGARVTEAAGNNVGDCRMRAVTFTSPHPPERVIDWYRRRAASAGYSSEYQRYQADQILAGANEHDGGAYYLIVRPAGRGSEIGLLANNGI
jgi:hypothetical protein